MEDFMEERLFVRLGPFHIILLGLILSAMNLCPLSAQSVTPSEQPGRIDLYFFYAEDCESCQVILQSYLPTLRPLFPSLEIKTFDVANPSYYEALAEMEKRLGRKESELPVGFIGDQILSGEKEFMERLNPLLLEYQMKGGAALPPLGISSKPKPSGKTFSVDLAYFHQKGCPKCERTNYLLKYLRGKYPHLNIKEIDLNTPDGKQLNETLSNRVNLPAEKRLIAPTIFIGNDHLSPEEVTESRIETLIRKYEKVEAKSALKVEKGEMKKAEESMVERFKSIGLLTILSAGLFEGMNPCAFATLIFFISYLTMVGRKRREIFWVGMGFSATGFLTHLLLGLGILSFVQHLPFLPMFSRIIYFITFLFALSLGSFSLYDYLQLKRGRPSKMKLQVPDFLKKKIHQIIRTRSGGLGAQGEGQSFRLLLTAVVVGFVVTLLQSACTSQVYLPTILFVTNIPSLRASAASYLVLYNVIYIVPLLIIFGIAYWGVTSEQMAFFLQKRASTIKLFTSLFFFALAGILIVSLL
jgi:glutaredoxin